MVEAIEIIPQVSALLDIIYQFATNCKLLISLEIVELCERRQA